MFSFRFDLPFSFGQLNLNLGLYFLLNHSLIQSCTNTRPLWVVSYLGLNVNPIYQISSLLFFIRKMCSGFVHLMIMVSISPPYFSRFWHSNKDLGISFSISRPFKWLRIDWYVSLLSVYLTDIARDLTSFSTPPTFIHYAPRLIVLTITQLFMYISPFYYLKFSFIMFTL